LALLFDLIVRVRPRTPAWIPVGLGAVLLAESAAAMTASTLMRFTTAASIWLLVGLAIAAPTSGFRRPNLGAFRCVISLGRTRPDTKAA
jgi:hypothetical protein